MTKTKTSKETSLEWAQKTYDKLKKKKDKPIKFRSGLEQQVAKLLEGLGISYGYETEKLGYTIEHNYTPDFVLPNYVYLEAKGYWSPSDRRKILNVLQANPEIDLRMVFQSPYNKINKKSKTTYAMWCDKHNIPWTSYHNIPIEWLI